MKLLRYTLLLAALGAALVACKKDKDEDEKEYLNGTLELDVPSFLFYGDQLNLEPTGVWRENKNDTLLSYSWHDPFTNITDTLRLEGQPATKGKTFTFKVSKDTLGTFSISASCWADGYYVKSAISQFTVVNPALGTGSLTGYDFLDAISKYTDTRDGNDYYYMTSGGLDWMIQNLAWKGAGVAYKESEAMSYIFGRYYDWDEAVSACPAGWRLPTDAEFVALAQSGGGVPDVSGGDVASAAGAMMIDARFNGDKMWEFWAGVTITNATRFSAIPAGFVTGIPGEYNFKALNYAMFWTADSKDANEAYTRYIYVDKPILFGGASSKSGLRASVRCVR